MGGIERQQRDFVRLGHPGAALTALIVVAIYGLFDPSVRVDVLLGRPAENGNGHAFVVTLPRGER